MTRRQRTFLVSTVGLGLAGALAVAGLVMAGNADFARAYVKDQLSQQHIVFSSLDMLTEEEKRSACLVKYAGQLLTTGKQAECYANEFIGLHVKEVAGGQTYADLGVQHRALTAKVATAQAVNDPALPDLQRQLATITGLRNTLFQGETSRGLLLTSFGFSDLGAKAGQAATVAYALAGLLALFSLAGLSFGLRASRATASVEAPAALAVGDKELVGV